MINAFSLEGLDPIYAVKIEHPDITDDIRVVRDTQDCTISGDTFTALAFDVVIPQRKDREIPRGQLIIDNVGRIVMEWVELSNGGRGAKVTFYSLVFEDEATRVATVSWELGDLDIANIGANNSKIVATISDVESTSVPAVKLRHDPVTSPGLF